MTEGQAVFSTAAFPTIEYFYLVFKHPEVCLEVREHVIKQTNRNRYHISGPAGLQTLHIPLRHEDLYRVPIGNIRISYDSPWPRTHWRTLEAAYNRSAFFEYYADELKTILFRNYEGLVDLNEAVLQWMLRSIGVSKPISHTEIYEQTLQDRADFRALSNCKNNNAVYLPNFKAYPQVFLEQQGFIPNLSFLDLLCSTGPSAKNYLEAIR